MSPHDMTPYREAFNQACASFGWTCREITVEHERDSGCSWREQVWFSRDGKRLFSESRLEKGLVEELIRLSAGYIDLDAPVRLGTVGEMLSQMPGARQPLRDGRAEGE